jgi:hypothetical protein
LDTLPEGRCALVAASAERPRAKNMISILREAN